MPRSPNAHRPKYDPTQADRETVKTMAAVGVPEHQIAKCLGEKGIDPKTLRKHFRRELDTTLTMAIAKVGGGLYQAAVGNPLNGVEPNITAAIFFLRCRAGWFQTDAHRFVDGENKDRPFNLADVDRIIAEAEAEDK